MSNTLHCSGRRLCSQCRDELSREIVLYRARLGPDAQLISTFRFSGLVRSLLLAGKYANARQVLRYLAQIVTQSINPDEVDVVAAVPTSTARRNQRGYDQAEVLAKVCAQGLVRPYVRCFVQHIGPPMTKRSRNDRLHGVRFVASSESLMGKRVLLIDDVTTTGQTAVSAARITLAHGAAAVTVCVVARTG